MHGSPLLFALALSSSLALSQDKLPNHCSEADWATAKQYVDSVPGSKSSVIGCTLDGKIIITVDTLDGNIVHITADVHTPMAKAPTPSTFDLFIMPGSDFVRPGLYPRSNLNIGIGHSMNQLGKIKVGDEMTFSYTYENADSHGFWTSNQGSHTEALGLMKNIGLSKTVGIYTWMQIGLTSITGGPKSVQNRFYNGESLGLIYHITDRHGIWLQEGYNKVATVPWYTTTSVGYTISW